MYKYTCTNTTCYTCKQPSPGPKPRITNWYMNGELHLKQTPKSCLQTSSTPRRLTTSSSAPSSAPKHHLVNSPIPLLSLHWHLLSLHTYIPLPCRYSLTSNNPLLWLPTAISLLRRYTHTSMSPTLHPLTVHPRRPACIHDPLLPLIPPLHIHIFKIESVEVAGNETEESEEDVDEEVGGTPG